MTLTEEQRFAIEMAIGLYDDEIRELVEGKYQMEGFEKYRAVLQAMIDSSEHFTGDSKLIGFDLERARDAVQMYNSNNMDVNTVIWGHKCAEYLSSAIDLIERLREDLADSEKRNEDLRKGIDDLSKTIFSGTQAPQIKELEAELEEAQESLTEAYLLGSHKKAQEMAARIKELGADLEQSEICIRARLEVIDQQAARIMELEAALVEERANKMIQTDDCTQNQDAADFHHRCICEYNVRKCPIEQWWLDRARQELRAEGKIGPDAKPNHVCVFQNLNKSDAITITGPHGKDHYLAEQKVAFCIQNFRGCHQHKCWQITEERKEAIRDAEIALRDAVLDSNDPHCWDAETAVLRAMLEEAA